jgi:sugar (pentulose or hexulose) kinase
MAKLAPRGTGAGRGAGTKSATERKETHLTEDAPGFTPDDPQEAWQRFAQTMKGVVKVSKEDLDKALAEEQETRRKGQGKS